MRHVKRVRDLPLFQVRDACLPPIADYSLRELVMSDGFRRVNMISINIRLTMHDLKISLTLPRNTECALIV